MVSNGQKMLYEVRSNPADITPICRTVVSRGGADSNLPSRLQFRLSILGYHYVQATIYQEDSFRIAFRTHCNT